MAQPGRLEPIVCPLCRSPTSCPNGVESLKTNWDKLFVIKMDKHFQEKDGNEA